MQKNSITYLRPEKSGRLDTSYRYQELVKEGGVRSVWVRHDLENFKNASKHLKIKSQTNGICERFHKTILNKFYQITFRKKLYSALEELQKDIDDWMAYYNDDRTARETLLDGKSIWSEKNLTQN